MKVGLKFDESSAGQIEGINDAGIETFAGDHLGSLAREQGQNSMDAKAEGASGPVEVTYNLLIMTPGEIPGSAELLKALDRTHDFWNQVTRKDDKALRVVNMAKKVLKSGQIPVLRIRDRNTTGLRGSNLEMIGDWCALTKSTGVSLKGEGKLGSFGIGKNVFWANSKLRTVFFSTHDTDDNWAFQGVTRLASHETNSNRLSRAVGYYGLTEGFAPIVGRSNIPDNFRPDGVGTDIFVVGFATEKNWEDGLIAAFAENFYVAFHKDILRVQIGKYEISADNIGLIVSNLADRDPNRFADLKNFYDTLVSNGAKEFTDSFDLIGRVDLRLMLCPNGPKRISMFRGTGMKIFEKAHFRTPLEFAGVLQCVDPTGNEFLRQVEPPSHNAWEAERYSEDPARATSAINALYKWMRRCVAEMYPIQDQNSLDIPDLEKFLPDDEDTEPLDATIGIVEGDAQSPIERILDGVTRKPHSVPDHGDQDTTELKAPDGEGEGGQDRGDGESNGNGGSGIDHPGGSGEGQEGNQDWIEIPRAAYRIFRRPDGQSKYVMNVKVPTIGYYLFELFAVGDDGRIDIAEPSSPSRVFSKGERKPLELVRPNKISNVEIAQGGSVRIEFELNSRVPLTLNAKVFRHG